MVFPMCNDGINDMFEPQEWDFNAYSANCYEQFKVFPRGDWAIINYGVCLTVYIFYKIQNLQIST